MAGLLFRVIPLHSVVCVLWGGLLFGVTVVSLWCFVLSRIERHGTTAERTFWRSDLRPEAERHLERGRSVMTLVLWMTEWMTVCSTL